MRSWRDFIIGLVIGAVALAAALIGYFRFGFAPVAVSSGPMPMEKYLAHAALHASTEKAGLDRPPIQATESNLLAGAASYRSACAVCHGLPGRAETAIQKGMYPHPPALLTGKGVTDDPAGSTHWVIQHGIRMTGMPSFQGSFPDEELWQLALLLAGAHNLPPSVQELLRQPDAVPVTAAPKPNTGRTK